jgi:hypothetical protein
LNWRNAGRRMARRADPESSGEGSQPVLSLSSVVLGPTGESAGIATRSFESLGGARSRIDRVSIRPVMNFR